MQIQQNSSEGECFPQPNIGLDSHLIIVEAIAGLAEAQDQTNIDVFANLVLAVTLMPKNAAEVYVSRLRQDQQEKDSSTRTDNKARSLLRLACDICIGSWAQPGFSADQAAYILKQTLKSATKILGNNQKARDYFEELVKWMWETNLTNQHNFSDNPQFPISIDQVGRIATLMGVKLPDEKDALAEGQQQRAAMNERLKNVNTGIQ